MNPFMIEDEDDDEETTQNSMSDEVEVELYGQSKVRSTCMHEGGPCLPRFFSSLYVLQKYTTSMKSWKSQTGLLFPCRLAYVFSP